MTSAGPPRPARRSPGRWPAHACPDFSPIMPDDPNPNPPPSPAGTATPLFAAGEKIAKINVADEIKNSFLDYSMSVIVARALPDARDGLKPSQRRILYAMHDLGVMPNRKHIKCAKIVGETMGNYHPHGDQAIYPTFTWRSPGPCGSGWWTGRATARSRAIHRPRCGTGGLAPLAPCSGGHGQGHGGLRAELRRTCLGRPYFRRRSPTC